MEDNNGGSGPSRRSVLKHLAAGSTVGMTALAGCSGGSAGSGGGDSVKVGFLADRTGGIAATGIPMYKTAQYWRDTVNANGGILDRDVELSAPDPQSDNQQYQNQARQLILEEQVDVLVGGITSASREAMRPTIDENKQLYFYPTQYEGGVCDEFTWVTAPTATQQLRPLIEYMMENFGSNAYFMAADYNFGQISADWAQIYVEEAGGQVLGQEFIPLSVSDFGSTIDRISGADPDWALTLTVGANHAALYQQAESAGLDLPMASTTACGGNYEHLTQDPPIMENVYGGWNYIQELPSDRNKEFVSSLEDEYPDTPYVNQMSMGSWVAFRMYEEAVAEAGTVDQQSVNEVLEGGLTVEGTPQGTVTADPGTHHVNQDVTITRVTEDHEFEFLGSQENLSPTWLQDNCDLTTGSTWENPQTDFLTPDPSA